MILKWVKPFPAMLFLAWSLPLCEAEAGMFSESGQLCEFKPNVRCLDRALIQGDTLKVPPSVVGIMRSGLVICDSSYNYTASPDIVLIMDNTLSMDSIQTVDGLPRWCMNPALETGDPGCISGDPHRLRGPALRTFLDSALVKGAPVIRVGVVLFNNTAQPQSDTLLPLTAGTIQGIKNSIVMNAYESTNYTAAFRSALNLIRTSKKPRSEQFIIFVSDGRPNLPEARDGGPYGYKSFWDSLPVVHSIFLGDDSANYKDMRDIADKTHGTFFPIRDVSAMGTILDSIAANLFHRAAPYQSVAANATIQRSFTVGTEKHDPRQDSGFALELPGPIYLTPGVNDITITTQYGDGTGRTQEVQFYVKRASDTLVYPNLVCRDRPRLALLNAAGEAINYLAKPYLNTDADLKYRLTTLADIDSFQVKVWAGNPSAAGLDSETVANISVHHVNDSDWVNSIPFQHSKTAKSPWDAKVQVNNGETVTVNYKNPYLPEDSVQESASVRYGPELNISGLGWAFANGSNSTAAAPPSDLDARQGSGFIALDSLDNPLQGNSGAKCGTCVVKQGNSFGGSLILFDTKYPVHYELIVYSNLGEVVAKAKDSVTVADMALLDKIVGADPSKPDYRQRLVWTGLTSKGGVAGNGVYVLKALFRYDKNSSTGSPASSNTKYIKFGFMRGCCESHAQWYE